MERHTGTEGVWQRVICGIGQFARNIDKRISSIRIDTGAWVANPDIEPEYFAEKARLDKEWREGATEQAITEWNNGGAYRLAVEAQKAAADGRVPWPDTIKIRRSSIL